MLLILGLILIVLWIFSLIFHFLGGFMYIALVLGVILAIAHFFQKKTT